MTNQHFNYTIEPLESFIFPLSEDSSAEICGRTNIFAQINSNKDHQRMMVDPMFMIVQSLRSFLTAVTPTAVAPIAVILPEFTWICLKLPELTWLYLNFSEFTWIYLNLPEFNWIYLNLPEFSWMGSLGFTWVYLGSLGLILVGVGDLICRVLNLENESTHKHTEDS